MGSRGKCNPRHASCAFPEYGRAGRQGRSSPLEEGTMREIRCLDKLIDELAEGRGTEKIL
ncbi:DUF2200 family protein [Nesterenkonia populi]|uniref:DUF2200 family protein n=1 Tax=Nesterenkonia populi TaxID=1591087 RepID=UPI0011BEF07B|nr:DUF2200 family protein [Nesterenkonia populi]